MREIEYTSAAVKDLRRLDKTAKNRIRAKLRQYAATPDELANVVTELVGEDAKRLRVGKYRVLFEETDESVSVLRVLKRDEAYR